MVRITEFFTVAYHAKSRYKHILYKIFGILAPPDTHIGKPKQPILPLRDKIFQLLYMVLGGSIHCCLYPLVLLSVQ